jgi:hypothetical protein
MTYHQRVCGVLWGVAGPAGALCEAGEILAAVAPPQRQHIVNHVEVRFLRVGVDADFILAAIGERIW